MRTISGFNAVYEVLSGRHTHVMLQLHHPDGTTSMLLVNVTKPILHRNNVPVLAWDASTRLRFETWHQKNAWVLEWNPLHGDWFMCEVRNEDNQYSVGDDELELFV